MSGYDFIVLSAWSIAEITEKLHLRETPLYPHRKVDCILLTLNPPKSAISPSFSRHSQPKEGTQRKYI